MDISHPSIYLEPEWIKIIHDSAAEAERSGSLHPDQLQLIYQHEWFKIFVPAGYGGAEMSLPEAVRLEEALSWADGSVGWTVTLCSGAGWFGGFLAPDFAAKIFSDPKVCLGGSGAPSGTAALTECGYQVTGKWKYATGAPHTTHFTANCIIKNGNETLVDKENKPLVLPFIFDKKDVAIINDWNTTGLIATASHSFEVNRLTVSSNNIFTITPSEAVSDNFVYKYPFLQFAEVTLAANISGMAIHFLDLCDQIFTDRMAGKVLKQYQQKVLTNGLSAAKKILHEKRTSFYRALEKSWSAISIRNPIAAEILKEISRTSRELAKCSLQQVNELYPYCGLIGATPSSEINRVWRDLHTASQHTLLAIPA